MGINVAFHGEHGQGYRTRERVNAKKRWQEGPGEDVRGVSYTTCDLHTTPVGRGLKNPVRLTLLISLDYLK